MITDLDDMPTPRSRLERIFSILGFGAQGKWIVYGVIIGAASGVMAWVFFTGLIWAKFYILGALAGAPPHEPAGEHIIHKAIETPFRPWLYFILPAMGGLISGLIVQFLAPEAEGHGTDAMVDAFHNKGGMIRGRVPLVKSVASLAILATGGSAGREGPVAQIGGGIGSWLAHKMGMSEQERRTMLLMGTGGGLGAIFRAPLGGAVTAIEVLYREDMEISALLPTVISSVTAYAIFSSFFGYNSIFAMPPFKFTHPKELPLYIILGILIAPVGIFYIKFFYSIRDFFSSMKIPPFFKPMCGGLLIGAVGLWFPQVYAGGYGIIQDAFQGNISPEFGNTLLIMLGLMFYKIFATSFTVGSGGSGGVFGPTLFIGGMLGGAVGLIGHHYWPGVVTQPGAFVVVGMAGFFAGVGKAPIGAILMIMEMTGGYGLLAPLMLVGALAIIFTRGYSLYENQVHNRLESPAHMGDYTINVLRELCVQDVFNPKVNLISVYENMEFSDIKKLIATTALNTFPVVDENGDFKGILSMRSARPGMFENGIDHLVLAKDISQPVTPVSLQDSLYEALMKFVEADYGQIPVVDPEEPKKVIGFFTHEDLMRAYRNEIIRRKGDLE